MIDNKGWKIFNKDLKCKGFQFEVGKEYRHEGEIQMCRYGFHFHTNKNDLFGYNNFDSENRVCEIEFGKPVEHGNDKSVAGVITIIRELTWQEVLNLVNTGKGNAGKRNSGYRNSGDRNSGDRNSGDRNSGYSNSGYRNSGDSNSGYSNSGYRNSGDRNSGDRNSGDWNSGDRNSGDWNSGNYNAGFLCTEIPPVIMFDKPTELKRGDISFPDFFYFDHTRWIFQHEMTDEEKEANPKWETLGGYLKKISYKEAWKSSWDKAEKSDRRKCLKLPNWNNEKFKTISGIDVEKELDK